MEVLLAGQDLNVNLPNVQNNYLLNMEGIGYPPEIKNLTNKFERDFFTQRLI